MEAEAFGELFPLFDNANPETLAWLLSVAVEHEYPADRVILIEDTWGNAVYFIASGWVKVRRLSSGKSVTLSILGQGDFFGEMAILDESPRSMDVVALSGVQLLSVPAQRFIQTLFKDSQLHHRLLQMMVRRLRQTNARLQIANQSPAVKLAHTLVLLGESYGQTTVQGTEIFNIPLQDLADLSNISQSDAAKVVENLSAKGSLKVDPGNRVMALPNLKQLSHLVGF